MYPMESSRFKPPSWVPTDADDTTVANNSRANITKRFIFQFLLS
jgi:hypothetical protein